MKLVTGSILLLVIVEGGPLGRRTGKVRQEQAAVAHKHIWARQAPPSEGSSEGSEQEGGNAGSPVRKVLFGSSVSDNT